MVLTQQGKDSPKDAQDGRDAQATRGIVPPTVTLLEVPITVAHAGFDDGRLGLALAIRQLQEDVVLPGLQLLVKPEGQVFPWGQEQGLGLGARDTPGSS